MAFPTIRAISEATDEGADGSPSFTNAALEGDLVIVLCQSATNSVFSAPVGENFTLLIDNAPTATDRCMIFWKIEDATPTATYNFTSGATNASGLIMAIATPGDGIVSSAFTNGSTSSADTVFPALNSTGGDMLSLLLIGWDHTNTGTPTNSTPTGYTEHGDFSSTTALIVSAAYSKQDTTIGTISPGNSTKDQSALYTAAHLLIGTPLPAVNARKSYLNLSKAFNLMLNIVKGA